MDMISQLPEHIQHHILDFLEQRQVCRAAVLSKAWRCTVESHPVLCFDERTYKKNRIGGQNANVVPLSELIDESIRNKTVVRRLSLHLQSYYLRVSHWNSLLDSWIQQLLNLGVEELTLGTGVGYPKYTLPPALFCSKTLKKLSLESIFKEPHDFYVDVDVKNCRSANLPALLELTLKTSGLNNDMLRVFLSSSPCLEILNVYGLHEEVAPGVFSSKTLTKLTLVSCIMCCSSVNLPNLAELTLETSTLSDEMFKNIVSGCPNLETMDISVTDGVPTVCVSGLVKLRTVKLSGSCITRVEIIAPRLRTFKFSGVEFCNTKIDLLGCESTLKVLWLHNVGVTTKGLKSQVSEFSQLEELVLDKLSLESIEVSNGKIRRLEINRCFMLDRVEIDGSNLEVLTYVESKLPFYPLDLSSCLNKFHASWKRNSPNKVWPLPSLMNMVSKLNMLEDIKLFIRYNKNVIVCEDLNENFTNMVCDMKDKQPEFTLKVMQIETHERMLNELSKLHHEKKIANLSLVSRDHQSHTKFLEIVKNRSLKAKKEAECCRDMDDQCWRHYLYHAKLSRKQMSNTPFIFRCYDKREYDITQMELQWNS